MSNAAALDAGDLIEIDPVKPPAGGSPASAGKTEAAVERRGQPKPKKKWLLIAAGTLGVLAAGGGTAGYLLWGQEGSSGSADGSAAAANDAETFVDVPPMMVNLRSADGSTRFLKVHLMLVPGSASPDDITAKLPLVIDSYQPFLRELRPEDLAGSAATYRLKEEMLLRSNAVLGAGSIRDVLIQDLVQQ